MPLSNTSPKIHLPECVIDFKNIPDELAYCFKCKKDVRNPQGNAEYGIRWYVTGFEHTHCENTKVSQ